MVFTSILDVPYVFMLYFFYSFLIRTIYSSELNTTALTYFTDCVTSLETPYNYIVDANGHLLLQPSLKNNSTLEDENRVFSCLHYSDYPIILTVFGGEGDDIFSDSRVLHNSSVPSLIMSGVRAFEKNGSVPLILHDLSNSTLFDRDSPLYYNIFPDENENDCSNTDLKHCTTGHCYSFKNKFRSLIASNPTLVYTLNLYIYPHHDCDKGNYRRINVPPGGTSSCQKRNTYSWQANWTKAQSIYCPPPIFNCIYGGSPLGGKG